MIGGFLEDQLKNTLTHYRNAFRNKTFERESAQEDILMQVFGITHNMKEENMQYWNRQLEMCWQTLVQNVCQHTIADYQGPVRDGRDELCDLVIGKDAVDTKYRIGSGDSGTIRKFQAYGARLSRLGLNPVLLILREDNLESSLSRLRKSGWIIFEGKESLNYVAEKTGIDLHQWLMDRKGHYTINDGAGS